MSFNSQEARDRQRVQDNYNDLVATRMKENSIEQGRVRAAADRRSLEAALAAGLHQVLRESPDVFSESRLAPSTVDAWASVFAGLIA